MDRLNSYLEQQRAHVNEVGMTTVGAGASASRELVPVKREVRPVEVPTNEILEEFKTRVRNWIEVDNNIKKLQMIVREQQALKRQLTTYVLEFMSKYNIEDLNTKDGKLRYKVSVTKAPVTRASIRSRLVEMYGKTTNIQELIDYAFTSDEKVEKPTLRRLKNTRETRID